MPSIFHPGSALAAYFATSSWNPFAYGPVASAPPTLSKRSSGGGDAGIVFIIVISIVVVIVAMLFFVRWIKNKHSAQYAKSAGTARWSIHRPLAQRTFRTKPTGTNDTAGSAPDLEMGTMDPPASSRATTPTEPPPSYHSRSLRNGARSGALAAGTMRSGTTRSTTRNGATSTRTAGITTRNGTMRSTMRTGAGRTGAVRAQASRSDRYRPSQTMSQYLESQARSVSSSTSEGRRAGAPSPRDYYGSQVGSVGQESRV